MKDGIKIEMREGPGFGIRHIQVLLMAILYVVMYATRYGFSVALVAMLEPYSPNPEVPVYKWNNKGVLLSSFFCGYVVPQIPIGILGTKFGTKYILLVAVFADSCANILIPAVASNFGLTGIAVCRVIQGFSQGLVLPSIHGLLGKWAPTHERTRMYGILNAGYTFGLIVGLSSTGFICASWAGWPLSFYLLPSAGLIWVIFYYFFGAASPASHNTITEFERSYIEVSLNSQNMRDVPIPFGAIFTSVPFASIILMSLCSGWGYSIITTMLPIYLDKVMHFNIRSNGLLSSLPHFCTLGTTGIVAFLADFLITRKYLSVGGTRKLMSSIGSLGCATLLLIFAYIPRSYQVSSITILTLSAVIRTANTGGYNVNHLDIAPNFGSTLMGLTNTASELFSLITPIAVQYIVYDETNQNLWRKVFLIAVVMYVVSTLVFVIFASGEQQWWNYVSRTPKDEEQPLSIDKTEYEKRNAIL